MIKAQLQTAFLDYLNNYLTVERYAEHNGLTVEQAQQLIDLGKSVHEDIAASTHFNPSRIKNKSIADKE